MKLAIVIVVSIAAYLALAIILGAVLGSADRSRR